jgi:group I intron endonuclease
MKKLNKCGIYGIHNIENGKWYIGQSVRIFTRWLDHKKNLASGNCLNKKMRDDWEKFGRTVFEFMILEECESNMLMVRESAWINYYDSIKAGYNHRPASHSCFGLNPTGLHNSV